MNYGTCLIFLRLVIAVRQNQVLELFWGIRWWHQTADGVLLVPWGMLEDSRWRGVKKYTRGLNGWCEWNFFCCWFPCGYGVWSRQKGFSVHVRATVAPLMRIADNFHPSSVVAVVLYSWSFTLCRRCADNCTLQSTSGWSAPWLMGRCNWLTVCERIGVGSDWFYLAWDRNQWWNVVNALIGLLVP
jgi:hypothetical protein